MRTFGELLRDLRQACRDPLNRKQLSQARLGQLLGQELLLKTGYSGAAISDWENGHSKVHKDDRFLLISILKVLYKNGGLKTLEEAESLMVAGNYRALDEEEKQRVFPKDLFETLARPTLSESIDRTTATEPPDRLSIFEFQSLVSDANEAAPPVWSLAAAAVMRRISDRMEAWDFVRLLIWLLVWIFGYWLLSPSLQWPFPNRDALTSAVIIYISASLVLPLCIGVLTNTRDNPVWKSRENAPARTVRLYTYEGAFMGFHVGYFGVFSIHLALYYLQLGLPVWFQFMLAGFSLTMGALGANVVPDNLWRAYEGLPIRKNGVVIVGFVMLGPFWGWFFLVFYRWLLSPALGVTIIITALILAAWITRRKHPTASIPQ